MVLVSFRLMDVRGGERIQDEDVQLCLVEQRVPHDHPNNDGLGVLP
jgi:hypothetical protein